MPQPDLRKRSKKLVLSGAALLCAGLLYGCVLVPLGVTVPCPIRLVTGLRCPGCGVSRMCLALMHLHFREALAYNYGLGLCLPFLTLILVRLTARYLKTGSTRLKKWENALVYAMAALLLAWGIARNLWNL